MARPCRRYGRRMAHTFGYTRSEDPQWSFQSADALMRPPPGDTEHAVSLR